MKKNKLLLSFLALSLFLLAGASCSWFDDDDDDNNNSSQESSENQNNIQEQNITLYAESDDQNAFDLLAKHTDVEYDESSLGKFITKINDLEDDDKHYWAFYVNGEYSQTGIDSTILKKGDKVEFKYEEIVM